MRLLTMSQKNALHCYDNGDKTIDRYTIVFLDSVRWIGSQPEWDCIGAGDDVTSPQGFYQHCTCLDGSHLGKRIIFEQLPTPLRARIAEEILEQQEA